MFKYIFTILILFSSHLHSNENELTVSQQLERLQREVSDLSQTVFKDDGNIDKQQDNNLVSNLSAIDMRIYDLEKDVKNLNAIFEDIFFQIEDLVSKINNIENNLEFFEDKFKNTTKIDKQSNKLQSNNLDQAIEENTLGSIKISSDETQPDQEAEINNDQNNTEKQNLDLSPEDQFQVAFDNIRKKNWQEAKNLFKDFIANNSNNQLSGSAHYWLGELYILENEYREAALTFAEGFQNFPRSIKAPDMLFKLSQSLYSVNKIDEACKTVEKFIIDYPKNKLIKKANLQLNDYGCLDDQE